MLLGKAVVAGVELGTDAVGGVRASVKAEVGAAVHADWAGGALSGDVEQLGEGEGVTVGEAARTEDQ